MDLIKMMAVATGALIAYAPAAMAEEAEAPELSASLDLPVLSAYVWRGQVLNDEPVLQPTFTIEKGGFALNWWGNFNLTDNVTGDAHEFSEHDVSVSYSSLCPLTGADVSLAVVNYDFPNSSIAEAAGADALVKNTHEAQVSFSYSEMTVVPTLMVAYDFNEVDGFYGNFSLGHSLELTKTLNLDTSASVGYADSDYNAFYFGVDDAGFNDVVLGLALPFTGCPEGWSLTPAVQYVMLPFDSDIEDGADAIYGEKDHVIGSLTASYSF